ncbi:hypothetical protein FB451DRAFT_1392112 [Mycena latifolia]|nr:hypothetical protein FB451DRAFT_1392112 [Mycena latifolia]
MSFQKDRFRYILLYWRRKDESAAQFRQELEAQMAAWDALPIVQKNRLSREVCLTASGARQPEGAALSGTLSSCDAVLIMDYASKEAYEEASVLRDPEAMKLNSMIQRDVQIITCEEMAAAAQKQ